MQDRPTAPANPPANPPASPPAPGTGSRETLALRVEAAEEDGGPDARVLRLDGAVTVRTVTDLAARLAAQDLPRRLVLDLGGVARMDTAGAWLLVDLEARHRAGGGEVTLRAASPEVAALIETVRDALPRPAEAPVPSRGLAFRLETLGAALHGGARTLADLLGYLGLFLARLGHVIVRPRDLPLTALTAHAEDVGLRAVPIVALMAFLIGVVLAFQGAAQLQQFGAEVFVVDLIAISILRELGILLTAIIVAGRTASAFTAAIGSMKMREEIDAMRILGLDPALVLFLPRILALVLMLPILGLIANVAGLAGGALMAWIELGISPSMFRTRLIEGANVSHVFVGLVKAPVFALIIGVVGCHAGMQVGGNAESLGRMTSKAVVAAIFAVIVADALFSVFFARIGI